ncbi:Hypothetical protein UVM_LOCUS85 [uncultured virus]|nr:Hypothetical protein UVM_LOCUS85 [uncultured virus]
MPGDNASTVAVAAFVEFSQNGLASPGSGIVRAAMGASPNTFQLTAIGTYYVVFQVSVNEPGQLVLNLQGAPLADTVVGRATGTSQLVGFAHIVTSVVNSILAVQNPAGNSTALTVTPLAGGTSPVSARLSIRRVS